MVTCMVIIFIALYVFVMCLSLQHRSVCVAVSALRAHLPRGHGDILVAGSFSARTVAHIAVHAAAGSGRVLVCGDDHTASQREEMQELLAKMDIKSECLVLRGVTPIEAVTRSTQCRHGYQIKMEIQCTLCVCICAVC